MQWIRYLELEERLDDAHPLALTHVAVARELNTSPMSSRAEWFFEAILCSTESPLVRINVKSTATHELVASFEFDSLPTLKQIARAVLAFYDETLLEDQ